MPIIKLFEQWLNEAEPASTAPSGDLATEIAQNSLKKPFASKVKPNFIVQAKLPIVLSSNEVEWHIRIHAYEFVKSSDPKNKIEVRPYTGLCVVGLPANHPSMKNNSDDPTRVGTRLTGNPTPTEEFIAKAGGNMSFRDNLQYFREGALGGGGSLADLYGDLTDFNGTSKMPIEEFVALIEAAKPGAKAELIAQCTTGNLTRLRDPQTTKEMDSYRQLVDWAKTQGGQAAGSTANTPAPAPAK